MKKQTLLVLTTLTVLGLIVAGVTPAAASVEQVELEDNIPSIEFTGVVEAIDGDQITVDGQVIIVNATMIESAGFVVGDMVEVEVITNENGELVAEYISLEDSMVDDMSDDSSDDAYDDMYDDSSDDSSYDSYDDDSDDSYDDSSDDDHDDDTSDSSSAPGV